MSYIRYRKIDDNYGSSTWWCNHCAKFVDRSEIRLDYDGKGTKICITCLRNKKLEEIGI